MVKIPQIWIKIKNQLILYFEIMYNAMRFSCL